MAGIGLETPGFRSNFGPPLDIRSLFTTSERLNQQLVHDFRYDPAAPTISRRLDSQTHSAHAKRHWVTSLEAKVFLVSNARCISQGRYRQSLESGRQWVNCFHAQVLHQSLGKENYQARRAARSSTLDAAHPEELKGLGLEDVRDLPKNDPNKKPADPASNSEASTDPYLWAAFQLSGEWQLWHNPRRPICRFLIRHAILRF